jgi:protein-disulfide isomerase
MIYTKKANVWKYSTFILAAVLIIGAFTYFNATNSSSGSTTGNVVQNLPSQNGKVQIPVDDSPFIGDEDAKVTIIEFSDFSCPYCGAASGMTKQYVDAMKSRNPSWEAPLPGIIKDYVDTGKVKIVFKYAYGHSGGYAAQRVAWCINDQGKFKEFYEEAFVQQDKVEDLNTMLEIADSLGADMTKLNSCLSSKKYESNFERDSKQAQEAGIGGTPTFFVNGKMLVGAQPYSAFKQAIDAEL